MAVLEMARKSDKAILAKLEESLKTSKFEATTAKEEVIRSNLELNKTKEEKDSLSIEIDQIVDVIVDKHENGFNKSLHQVALLAPHLDLSSLTMTHDVIDGKLVPTVSLDDDPPCVSDEGVNTELK
ncbi:hypothetical protein CR513_42249, partial [Mucuna pruriens]